MDLFTSPILTQGVLPFLLVFVLVFAILQKSKILGDGKAQIDALISLAIALILVGMPTPRDYIVNMMPWLAVALVILLVFMLVYGFVASDNKDGLTIPDWLKSVVLWIGIIFVILLVLNITGKLDTVKNWFSGETLSNILIIVAVVAAMWVALGGKIKGK